MQKFRKKETTRNTSRLWYLPQKLHKLLGEILWQLHFIYFYSLEFFNDFFFLDACFSTCLFLTFQEVSAKKNIFMAKKSSSQKYFQHLVCLVSEGGMEVKEVKKWLKIKFMLCFCYSYSCCWPTNQESIITMKCIYKCIRHVVGRKHSLT